jgi:hypothetical protein
MRPSKFSIIVTYIMAIAAVVLAVVKAKWPAIKGFFNTGVDGAVAFDG